VDFLKEEKMSRLRAIWRALKGIREQRNGCAEQGQRMPFQRMRVPDQTRSTFFDPEQGLHTQTSKGVYFFDCGHISGDPVGGGRCYLCQRWVCPRCLSQCVRCGALLCNVHSIKLDARTYYCPECYEQIEERMFFDRASQVIKSIFFFPFKE